MRTERKNRRKFGVKMDMTDIPVWLDGRDMPENGIRDITGTIKVSYAVKIAIGLIIFAAIIIPMLSFSDYPPQIFLAIALVLLWIIYHVYMLIKRLRVIRNRTFKWQQGVTDGGFGGNRGARGGVWVKVGEESYLNYTIQTSFPFIGKGKAVYTVQFNAYNKEDFSGGFLFDPIIFKKKS